VEEIDGGQRSFDREADVLQRAHRGRGRGGWGG
jgi:hypothetical protein